MPRVTIRCLLIGISSFVALFTLWYMKYNDVWHKDYISIAGTRHKLRAKDGTDDYPSTGVTVSWKDQDALERVNNADEQIYKDNGYRRFAFNILVSDRLSFSRPVPDSRHPLCDSKFYPTNLPSASIIICFYNEAWSVLLRMIHSIVQRTPEKYLHEIILLDDFSDMEELQKPLRTYMRKFTKVKVIRTERREGLIRARAIGAQHATGEVLVFLDSHCEVNVNWLEPMLSRIYDNRTNVAIPIIDIINQDSFKYQKSPLVRGGFNWGMHFKWDAIPHHLITSDKSKSEPIQSPTMAGGLFAIERRFFYEMGEYDVGMDTWGGENLELSFRIWMCGGNMEIIPCSRIGHIFRRKRPYSDPTGQDSMTKNSLRVAHVWMDDFIKYFFMVRPDAQNKSFGDVTDRVSLRKRLKCHSFSWYLNNIYPEQTLPSNKTIYAARFNKKPAKALVVGLIQLADTDLCLVSSELIYTKRAKIKLAKCAKSDPAQEWVIKSDGSLVLAKLLCLDYNQDIDNSYPLLMKCTYRLREQQWRFYDHYSWKGTIDNPLSSKCLTVKTSVASSILEADKCEIFSSTQQFNMIIKDRLF